MFIIQHHSTSGGILDSYTVQWREEIQASSHLPVIALPDRDNQRADAQFQEGGCDLCVRRCVSVCVLSAVIVCIYVYGYLYVNVCVCLLMEIYICYVYLVCCLCLCSLPAQFRIHQSVLSPCFGSPRLSVKDITQCRIHHDSAIQQSVKLFKFAFMPLQLLFQRNQSPS